MSGDLSINPADIENIVVAVRIASKRGAFEMEETAQLLSSVTAIEKWIEGIKVAQNAAADEAAKNDEATKNKNPATTKNKKGE